MIKYKYIQIILHSTLSISGFFSDWLHQSRREADRGLAVHALIYILLIFKFDLYRGACGGGRPLVLTLVTCPLNYVFNPPCQLSLWEETRRKPTTFGRALTFALFA
jgi:hypothetical protein